MIKGVTIPMLVASVIAVGVLALLSCSAPPSSIRILFFTSPTTCPNCLVMEPVVAQVSNVITMDVDKHPEFADQWHIAELPVFVAVDDKGYEIRRVSGPQSLGELQALATDPTTVGAAVVHTAVPASIAKCRNAECACPDCKCVDCKCAKARPAASQVAAVVSSPPEMPAPSRPPVAVSEVAKVAATKPAPYRVDPDKPARGPDGWRLRLFYPPGSARGEAIRAKLSGMNAIATKYGFDSATTNEKMFSYWREQLRADEVTLVLVHPDNRIVYQATRDIPTDPIVLREELRDAARESWKAAIPVHEDSNQWQSTSATGRGRR